MDLYIIAGPNGVGKTTFARKFLPNYSNCKNFINADLIAEGISPFSPEAAVFAQADWSSPKSDRLVIVEFPLLSKRHCQSEAICD